MVTVHRDHDDASYHMFCENAVSKRFDDIVCGSRGSVAPRWGLTDMLWWDASQGCAEGQGDALPLGSTLGYRMTPRWGYARVAAASVARVTAVRQVCEIPARLFPWYPHSMITAAPPSDIETLDQLVERLGSVPLERIRLRPAPGTATEADLLAEDAAGRRLCELVDGVLVEKPAGFLESRLAHILGYLIESYLEQNRIGIVSGADGPIRLIVGLVRMPDVAFFSRGRLPGGQIPRDAIANVIPDLAVEVISRKNTAAEMRRKVREYFEAGVRLVWLVDGVVPLRGNHNRSDDAERHRYKTAPP